MKNLQQIQTYFCISSLMIICSFSGLAYEFCGLIFILKFALRKKMEAISSLSKVRKLNWGEVRSLSETFNIHRRGSLCVLQAFVDSYIQMYLTGMPSMQAWTWKGYSESKLVIALPYCRLACVLALGPCSVVVHASDSSWICFFLGLWHHAMFPLIFFNCLGNRVSGAFRSKR